jgi:hypothetical protein
LRFWNPDAACCVCTIDYNRQNISICKNYKPKRTRMLMTCFLVTILIAYFVCTGQTVWRGRYKSVFLFAFVRFYKGFLTLRLLVSIPGNPCGICSLQSGTGTYFSPSTLVSPVSIVHTLFIRH